MSLDMHAMSAVLDEIATLYETAAALPPVVERHGAKVSAVPGPRVPPGLTEAMDADEHARTLADVDLWASWAVHVLIDAQPGIGTVPDHAPGRLRLVSRWARELCDLIDEHERLDVADSLREHRRRLRGLTRRGAHTVQTGSPCLDADCPGEYVATIDGPKVDSDLVCSTCQDRVGYEKWTRWEEALPEWVTVEHAAWMLGIAKSAVKMRALRGEWPRIGTGKNVRYCAKTVRESARQAMAEPLAQ